MNARGQIREDPSVASHVIAQLLEGHFAETGGSSSIADFVPAGVIARHLAERFGISLSHCPERHVDMPNDVLRRHPHILLLKCLLDDDRHRLTGFAADIKDRQIPFAAVYRHLISPAMNLLGELWSDDEADFATVSIATSRMQSLVHDLAAYGTPEPVSESHKRVLFTRPENEQHTLGLATVIACFQEGGWSTDGGIDFTTGHGLQNILGTRRYDVLGISLGSQMHAQDIENVISNARAWSVNERIKIALGGPLICVRPEAVRDAGADFCSTDAVEALDLANRFTPSDRPRA